jgi:hypothetical protein
LDSKVGGKRPFDLHCGVSPVTPETLHSWLIVLGCAGIYFLPSTVAAWANSRFVLAIFALNLLLGWTGLGWICALVWACVPAPMRARV